MQRALFARIYIVVVMVLVFFLIAVPAFLNRNRVSYVKLPGINGVIPEDIWKNENLKIQKAEHSFYAKTGGRKYVLWGVELTDMGMGDEVLPCPMPEASSFRGMDADEIFRKLKEEIYLYHDLKDEKKADSGGIQKRLYVSEEMTDKGPSHLYSVLYVDGDYAYWQAIMIMDYQLSDSMQETILKEIGED